MYQPAWKIGHLSCPRSQKWAWEGGSGTHGSSCTILTGVDSFICWRQKQLTSLSDQFYCCVTTSQWWVLLCVSSCLCYSINRTIYFCYCSCLCWRSKYPNSESCYSITLPSEWLQGTSDWGGLYLCPTPVAFWPQELLHDQCLFLAVIALAAVVLILFHIHWRGCLPSVCVRKAD